MEKILLSSKNTALHDDVLRILFLHMDPILPLPWLRMLSVLYHVLGVDPASQGSVGPALNELCLGLQPHEVAHALSGVYAEDVHVRMACLIAIKCIPVVINRTLSQDVEVATSIWIALHDPEKFVAELADDIWDRYGHEFGTLVQIIQAFSKHFRMLTTMFEWLLPRHWLPRYMKSLSQFRSHCQPYFLCTFVMLDLVGTILMLADANADVRGRMINAGKELDQLQAKQHRRRYLEEESETIVLSR
ncbi:eIF-2-alpha kinase activator GCN1 [Orobanche hederae]